MTKLLPFIFLASFASLFGLAWIITGSDPDNAPWYIFATFVVLLFIFIIGTLGLLVYFFRTRLNKRSSATTYFYTSFKMAAFAAAFASIAAILAILDLVSTINVILAIVAISLFALWSYLGRKAK